MAIYTYRHYQPGTFQEHFRNKELEFSKENAPSKIAGGEMYEICINQIITHITAGLEFYAGTNHD